MISRMFQTAARQQRSDREGRDVNLLADDAKRISCRGGCSLDCPFSDRAGSIPIQALSGHITVQDSIYGPYKCHLPIRLAIVPHFSDPVCLI